MVVSTWAMVSVNVLHLSPGISAKGNVSMEVCIQHLRKLVAAELVLVADSARKAVKTEDDLITID